MEFLLRMKDKTCRVLCMCLWHGLRWHEQVVKVQSPSRPCWQTRCIPPHSGKLPRDIQRLITPFLRQTEFQICRDINTAINGAALAHLPPSRPVEFAAGIRLIWLRFANLFLGPASRKFAIVNYRSCRRAASSRIFQSSRAKGDRTKCLVHASFPLSVRNLRG